MADACEDLDAVGLDLHAPAAAVAALAAAQLGVDGRAVHGDAGRKALDHHGQGGAVRLAGGQEAEGHERDTSKPLRKAQTERTL